MRALENHPLSGKDSSFSDNMEKGNDLWIAVKRGDHQAFTELMRLHYRPLFSYGSKLSFDKELVRDCIQEVFLEIWRRRAEIGVADSPRFYLLRALQRRLQREIKRNRVLNHSEEINQDTFFSVEFSVESDLIAQQEHELNARRLTSLINSLPNRQKEAVYLRFYQNLSYDEIADFMQLNRQSVYNLIGESLKVLRKKWDKAWPSLIALLTSLHAFQD